MKFTGKKEWSETIYFLTLELKESEVNQLIELLKKRGSFFETDLHDQLYRLKTF